MDFLTLPTLGPDEPLAQALTRMRSSHTHAVVIGRDPSDFRIYLNSEIARAMTMGARYAADLPPSNREVAALDPSIANQYERELDRLDRRYGIASFQGGLELTVVTRFEKLAQDIKMAPEVCMCTNGEMPHFAVRGQPCGTCGRSVECY